MKITAKKLTLIYLKVNCLSFAFAAVLIIAPFIQPAVGQGIDLFDNTRVHQVKFSSLNPADWDSIARRYTRKLYTPLKVEIDGTVVDSTALTTGTC